MLPANADPIIQINPNPTADWFNIAIEWPAEETLHLMILDQNGRQIFGKQLHGGHLNAFEKIDASLWPSGSYTVVVAGKSQKMVKQLIRF